MRYMHCLRLKTGQNESITDRRDVYPSLKSFGALQTPRTHISLEGQDSARDEIMNPL